MRIWISALLLSAVGLGLVGCGSEAERPGLDMLKQAAGSVFSGQKKTLPTAAEVRASLTPQVLAKIGRPVMVGQLPTLGLADVLILVQQNGAYLTWASSDGVSFAFKDGLLTGTRGMGFDLMTADVDDAAYAVAQAGGEAERVHRYLNGESQLIIRAFRCRYGRQNGVVTETCYSPHYTFENQYWIGSGGQIIKSRQWIGPERGYLITERVQ